MWRELRADVELQLDALARSMSDTAARRDAMLSCPPGEEPDSWDRRAAAFAVQECYGGIENVLKRIAVLEDHRLPAGGSWHVELMRQLAEPTAARPALIPPALLPELLDCLGFRHVARTHYGFDLEWARLRSLVERLPALVENFSRAARAFLEELERR